MSLEVYNKGQLSDEEIDRALMQEIQASLHEEKHTEKDRYDVARKDARSNVGKEHPMLGRCVATMPPREYFRLIKKYGHAEVHSKEFLKYFQNKFSDLSPNKI
jgi:hypothetical protein|tara:strand:- start:605 stop:913 length:309 start_codon:yes stop_codon:yes gene_type:complete